MDATKEFTTLSRFATQVGVTPAAVSNWRSRNPKTFPLPVRELDESTVLNDPALEKAFRSGKLFSVHALVQWARENGRLGQLDVDDDLSPLYALAASLDGASRPARGDVHPTWSSQHSRLAGFAVPAMAIAAGRIYEFSSGDANWMAIPELAPIAEVFEEFRGRGSAAVFDLEHLRKEMTDRGRWLATIDGLRADFANLTSRGAWTQTLEMAQLVDHASGATSRQLRVVDPCCGDGGLLSMIGRRARDGVARGSRVHVVGRDVDPMQIAIAYALLHAEGFDVSLSLGSPFDETWIQRTARHSGPTVVATIPRSSLNSSGPALAPRSGDDWVDLVGNRLGSTTIGTTAVKRPWLGGRRLTDVHHSLLDEGRLLAVEYPSASSDLAFVVVRAGATDRATWPPGVMLNNLQGMSHQEATALTGDAAHSWANRLELPPELQVRVRIVDEQVLRDRQSLTPPTPTAGPAPAAPAAAAPSPRTSSSPASDSVAARGGDRPRHSTVHPPTLAAISPGPGRPQQESAARELPRVPLRTLNEVRRLMDRAPDDLTEFVQADDEPPRILKDAIRDREIVVIPTNEVHLQPEHLRIVQLVTSPLGFGQVDLVPVKALTELDLHRGQVLFAVPFRSKDTSGLSPEFLAGWLASLRVQRAMRRELDPGRQRDTLSISKVERLPADFPDPERCQEIAQRWAEYERVKEFSERLPGALAEWKLHLADKLEPSPTED